jgi:hypothetical protein
MCTSHIRWLSKINPKNLTVSVNGKQLPAAFEKAGVREYMPESAEMDAVILVTKNLKLLC